MEISENQRREQLQWAKRAIDEYFWNRPIRDEVGVACQAAFEALIEKERGELVRVVRCKNCRCGKESVDLFGNPAIECEVNGETQPLDWFCAGAAPREDT